MPPTPLIRLLSLATLLVAAACGGTHTASSGAAFALRTLPEARALTVVREALREAGTAAGPPFSVEVGPAPFEVDVALADTAAFGIEWVSASDRLERDDLPAPLEDGQLRILPGTGDDAGTQILLLDERTYRYDPSREAVQAGAPGMAEAELRLRRDVTDFVTYARGIGS